MKRSWGVVVLALVVASMTGCATLFGGGPGDRGGSPYTGGSYGGRGQSGGCH